MTALKLEIKQLLIDALNLEDLTLADIGDDTPLFNTDGLGLDSIDALEIGIALRKKYQLQIETTDSRMREHFRSVSTLADWVTSQRNASTES